MGLGACPLVVAFQALQTTWTEDKKPQWKLACGSQICKEFRTEKRCGADQGLPSVPSRENISLAHLCSWLPLDTEGILLLAPVSSLSMLIHSGETQRRETERTWGREYQES